MSSDSATNIFGERLFRKRQERGLSQMELAEAANISSASIIAYEKGQKSPSLTTACEIARALNISLDWLCGLSEDEGGPEIETFGQFISSFTKILFSHALITQKIDRTTIFRFGEPFREFETKCADMFHLHFNGTIDRELFTLWLKNEAEKNKHKDIWYAMGGAYSIIPTEEEAKSDIQYWPQIDNVENEGKK